MTGISAVVAGCIILAVSIVVSIIESAIEGGQ